MPYLFDTNHCIYIMNGWNAPEERLSPEERRTIEMFNSKRGDIVYMSEASVGELLYGVARSQRKTLNMARLQVLLTAIPPVSIIREAWEIYGQTKAELSITGTVIPDIDLLIASTAKCYQLVLVANDKHMSRLPASFAQENWAATGGVQS